MMKKIFQLLVRKENLILISILLVGLFFRLYKLDVFYSFEHDQDLYSWIVKDIWINQHLRLIGQVTSIEGVFIGPLYYYLLVPFFVIFGMNPIAAPVMAAIIGLLTIWSIHFVFSRFFGQAVGLFGAAIYAASLGTAFFDRWVVPTQPTMLWCAWLLYAAFSLVEGKTRALVVAAILLGTIWHIHIALLPLIPLLLVSFFLSKQKITPKIALIGLGIFVFLTLPFWIFELKYNFLQSKSLLFTSGTAGKVLVGMERFVKIIDATKIVINASLFTNWSLPLIFAPLVSLVLFLFSVYKKLLTKKQIIVLLSWVILIIVIQQITKNPISEYYVANLTIIPILLLSLLLGYLWQQKRWRYLATGLIVVYTIVNVYLLLTKPEDWNLYKYKEQTVEYISQDAKAKNYPCISVNYIAKYGTAVGFRYLIWWKQLNLVRQESGAPLYTIVIPYDAIPKEQLSAQFRYFGVILPKDPKPVGPKVCNDPRYEPIAPLGFTN